MREPWLRGIDLGAHPAAAQPLFALQQVREDLEHFTSGLSGDEIWASPLGLASAGFHLRRLAGSTERLTTYLLGQALSAAQIEELESEQAPGITRDMLLDLVRSATERAGQAIRDLDPADFPALRHVGRGRVPVAAIGLAIHIGEHAQRHCGQIISACHLVRAWRPESIRPRSG